MAEPDVTAPCAHHPRCGGCPLMSLDPRAQSTWKRERLRTALDRYRSLRAVALDPMREAPTREEYRTRLKWMSDGRGALGLFAAQEDHVVVDATDCRVAAPIPKAIAAAIRDLLGSHLEVRAALRAIDVREVDASLALVTLVFHDDERPSTERLTSFTEALVQRCPMIIGVAENEKRRGAVQVLGARTRVIRGVDEARATTGDVEVLATFGSFVQAHGAQAEHLQAELVRTIVAQRGEGPLRVLELFAGSAPFGLALARRGALVTSVESFEPAARRIERSATAQRLTIDARASDATDYVRSATPGAFDVVLVDPPRRGLARPLREALVRLGPKLIAYVSCDPDTLARDVADLVAHGYAPDRVRPIDMMPHTREVESLTYLSPAPPPPERVHHASVVGRIVEGGGDGLTSGLRCEGRPEVRRIEVEVLAKGVARGKGRLFSEGGHEARYQRLAVVGGHTHARVTIVPTGPKTTRRSPYGALLRAFARVGHPVLGDGRACDAATLRFMEERCGIDRPMIDTLSIMLHDESVATTERAGDFALALARLSAAETDHPRRR